MIITELLNQNLTVTTEIFVVLIFKQVSLNRKYVSYIKLYSIRFNNGTTVIGFNKFLITLQLCLVDQDVLYRCREFKIVGPQKEMVKEKLIS